MYAYANELQAAHAVSEATTDFGSVVVPEGCFGVVQLSLAFCRFTDATLRNPYKRLVRVAGTRRIAEYFERKLIAELTDDEHGEVWFEVWPLAPRQPAPANVADDDEIPF